MRIPRRNERGFTLIELLVSSLIMSVVVVTLSMVFSTIIKVWVTGLAEAEMVQNARGALFRIAEDMQAVVPPYKESVAEFIGITDPADRVGTDSVADEMLYYVSVYNSVEGRAISSGRAGDITKRWIWLKKVTGSDSRLQYLVSNGVVPNATPYGLDVDSQPGRGLTGILTNDGQNAPFAYYVANFQAEYADTAGVWYQEWDSRSTGGLTAGTYDDNKLPAMIRVTLQMADPKNTIPPRNYTLTIRPGPHPTVESFLATGL